MKKYLKLVFMTLACSNLLMANIVFNLGGQQFSNSVEGKFKDSTYDLSNSIVSTSLKFDKGHYIPNGSGSFKVELKESRTKWGVTFDMDCYLSSRGAGVILLGKDGKTLTLFFSYQNISVNGKVLTDGMFRYGQKILGSIESDGQVINVVINGKFSFKVEKPNFKLAYIDINLGTEFDGNLKYPDKLNSLAISSSSD